MGPKELPALVFVSAAQKTAPFAQEKAPYEAEK